MTTRSLRGICALQNTPAVQVGRCMLLALNGRSEELGKKHARNSVHVPVAVGGGISGS